MKRKCLAVLLSCTLLWNTCIIPAVAAENPSSVISEEENVKQEPSSSEEAQTEEAENEGVTEGTEQEETGEKKEISSAVPEEVPDDTESSEKEMTASETEKTAAEESSVLEETSQDEKALSETEELEMQSLEPVDSVVLTFTVSPEKAQICVYTSDGERIYPTEGQFVLAPDTEYTYTAACAGYVGQKGTVQTSSTEDLMEQKISLEKAAESAALPDLDAEYPGFRADKNNQSVISAKTPITQGSIEVKWERQIGTGVNPSSGSTPVIAGGNIYTQSAGKLYMLDKETGEILKSSDCALYAGLNLIPVTYGDGMIFVPLSNGIQCFNATTLESLWVYENPLIGACNSPIRYDDGKVYIGFQGSTNEYFVCLTTTDEDPSDQTERKIPLWTNYGDIGYWWAGAWTNEKYVFVLNQSAELMVMDNRTGETVQKIKTKATAARSDVSYYNGRIYFSTQSGYVYSYNLDKDGKVDLDHLIDPLKFSGESTCTPAIYNNRLYIGISGGSSAGEDGSSILVADINPDTGSMKTAYLVPTKTDFGYCKTSGLIINGYEQEDGYVYVYFLCNNAKGDLYMVKDKPGVTSPLPESGLFYTPNHEEYCIASAVADRDGTIYIKNDSSWQFAIRRADSYLSGIEVSDADAVIDGGEEFAGAETEHTITVHKDTKEITLRLTATSGTDIRINGQKGNSREITLDGDSTVVEVQLVKGDTVKSYTFTIYRGPVLSEMKVASSYTASGLSFTMTPEFQPAVTEYAAGLTREKSINSGFVLFDLVNADDIVSCKVVSGVRGKSEGETLELKTGSNGMQYATVPFEDRTAGAKNTAVVDLTIESDTLGSRTYRVTLYTNDALPILTLPDNPVAERTNTSAKIQVTANKAGTIWYLAQAVQSEAPDAAKIVAAGQSYAAIAGENSLNITEVTRQGYTVYMVLKAEDGMLSAVKQVSLESLWLLGDLDGNGTVELSDVVLLLDKVTANEKVDNDAGDINGDGTVNLNDVVQLLDQVTAGH